MSISIRDVQPNRFFVTQDIYESPGVRDALGAHQIKALETAIRGIREKVRVYKISE